VSTKVAEVSFGVGRGKRQVLFIAADPCGKCGCVKGVKSGGQSGGQSLQRGKIG